MTTLTQALQTIQALLSGWKQTDRLMRLHSVLGPEVLLAEALQASESLSGQRDHTGFRVELTALSTNAHLNVADLIGHPARLDLLTQQSRTALRPFHGHITSAQQLGSNGGFARYQITLEPWLSFLRYRQDSYVFQAKSVIDIVESVFADYQHQGKLAPKWRWDLADASVYPKRSLTMQYQETDLAFVERLLAEEGLFYWFDHASGSAPSLGSHTLVISDHNGAFKPNAQATIRYSGVNAMTPDDTFQHWHETQQLNTNAVAMASWDYRSVSSRAVNASASGDTSIALAAHDDPGTYLYEDRAQGERIAENQLLALQARTRRIHADGTVRTLAPASTFTLTEFQDDVFSRAQAAAAGASHQYLTLGVTHQARNNFSADLAQAIGQLVGNVAPLTNDGNVNLINSLSSSVQNASAAATAGTAGSAGSTASAATTATGGVLGAVGSGLGNAVGGAVSRAGHSVLAGAAGALGHAATQTPLQQAAAQQAARASRAHSTEPTQYYRNRAELMPASVSYKPAQANGHGQRLHPKPTISGTQTAIVMSDGNPALTDRDHRIKVQFHWQRGANSASRNSHPSSVGNDADNAQGTDAAGTWVRVATPVAGANWGSHFIPRAGQEVLVGFMHGDIDRPVVLGAVYNGVGSADAQSNQIGSGAATATGNASAWFAGEAGDHAHNAVLSGIKTQSMDASQSGDGGYNQLVFDDSPGQSRSGLMSTQAHSQLSLGHQKHQHDNARKASLGHGAELTTQGAAALRAGQGVLISTDAKPNASGQQMDSREASSQIESSKALSVALIDTAQKQNAQLKAGGKPEAEAKKLAVVEQLDAANEAISATSSGGDSEAGGGGSATAYSEPHIQFSSPDGIVALTPKDAILSAGNVLSLIAGQDINLLATGNYVTAIKEGLSIFTYGKASNPNKPNQETGIKLHAASGSVSVQAQSGPATLTADKAITIASTNDSINIAAKGHVLMTAGGAYIKMEGGNIEVHAPGMVLFKATAKELAGPQSSSQSLSLPKAGELKGCADKMKAAATNGGAV